jgi:uncharacterized protein
MTILTFTIVVWAISALAGFLGALTGLGGGVIVVPALTLALGVDLKYAIGASLVSVIATSSGAAAAYVREGYSNIRIGMFLEIATTIGAVIGAGLAAHISTHAIAIIFGIVLLQSAWQSVFGAAQEHPHSLDCDKWGARLRLGGDYPLNGKLQKYGVCNVPAGLSMMFGAGALSGLLGIGSGAVKVIAMDRTMRIPFKVSSTTSNFMIGVTAAASAGVYFVRGEIAPLIAAPVAAGVLIGATAGSRLLPRLRNRSVRIAFVVVLLYVSAQMLYNGVRG